MSVSMAAANLADTVRVLAKTRGEAIVFEFEGRRTDFAEFDKLTNRVATPSGGVNGHTLWPWQTR